MSVRVLALDLGSRRIGVAVSDPTGTLASPLHVLERSGDESRDHDAIAQLVGEYDATHVLVGLPLSLSGEEGPAAAAARTEIERLGGRLDVDVEAVDERLTTVQAHRMLGDAGKNSRQRRATVDAAAAAVMLQAWLDAHSHGDGS